MKAVRYNEIMLVKSILLRKGIRSDKIWCNPMLFREPFRRIPFYMDVYALTKSQYWPREELKKLQLERFAAIVKHASQIPFWKERFQKAGIDPNHFQETDIAKIPILTKKDFFDRKVEEYTVSELLPTSDTYSTSGSTGNPLTFYLDRAFELRSAAVHERATLSAGEWKRFPFVVVKTGVHKSYEYLPHVFFHIGGYNSVRHRIKDLQRVLSTYPSGVVLTGLGSSMLELARVCDEQHVRLPIVCIMPSGEALEDPQKKEIEEKLHTSTRVTYGTSEFQKIGTECSEHRIHLLEEMAYFEVTDDAGTTLPTGTKGHLVVTGFENKVMPFIRYDLGDFAKMSEDVCPCGNMLRTVTFEGRNVKLLHVGDGRTVSLLDFSHIFGPYINEIRQFQIVRTGEHDFTIYIIPGTVFDKERIEKGVVDRFTAKIHPHVQIQWEIVESIPEGPNNKARYFIDNFEKDP